MLVSFPPNTLNVGTLRKQVLSTRDTLGLTSSQDLPQAVSSRELCRSTLSLQVLFLQQFLSSCTLW